MAGTNKTFKDLQDYAVNPPPGLFKRLWKRIRNLETGAKTLAEGAAIPETKDDIDNSTLTEEEILASLRSYSSGKNAPPPFDYRKISEAVGSKGAPAKSKKIISLFYEIAAAAVITGIIVSVAYLGNNKDEDIQKPSSLVQQNNPSDTQELSSLATIQRGNTENTQTKHLDKQHYPVMITSAQKITGETVPYNDFIYSFASFSNKESKNFLKNLKKNRKISIDHYSYLNVSDRMEDFLKKMYAVNKKGNSTRSAKKLKSKLKKWKKKDEKYFDIKKGKNPLDILDLSELILK